MDKDSLNRRSIWIAGLGTGLLVYGIMGKNLRYSKSLTIAAGVIALVISGVIFMVTRKKKV